MMCILLSGCSFHPNEKAEEIASKDQEQAIISSEETVQNGSTEKNDSGVSINNLPAKAYDNSGAEIVNRDSTVSISGFEISINYVKISQDYNELYNLLGDSATSEIALLKSQTEDVGGSYLDTDLYKSKHQYVYVSCTIKNCSDKSVLRQMAPLFYYKTKDGAFGKLVLPVLSFTGAHTSYMVPNVGITAYDRYTFNGNENLTTVFVCDAEMGTSKTVMDKGITIYLSDSFLMSEKVSSSTKIKEGSHLIPIISN